MLQGIDSYINGVERLLEKAAEMALEVNKKAAGEAKADKAMVVNRKSIDKNGGIDFSADKVNLEIQNSSQGINLHLDSVQLEELKNVSGFVPVIINIQPIVDIKEFLDK